MTGVIYQQSFSKGEVTPELGGRGDLSTYKSMLATGRNIIVRPYGSIINRPGTMFIGFNINGTEKSRLRRFRFNTNDTYMLEFNQNTMRVIKDDAYVLEGLKNIAAISNTDPSVMQVPAHGYNQGDAIQVLNSIVGMPQISGRWLLVGPIIDANNFQLHDPVGNGPVDATQYGVYVSGGSVARVYTITTPYAAGDLPVLSFVQSADVMTITDNLYNEMKLTRTGDAAWTLTAPVFAPAAAQPSSVVAVVDGATGSTQATYAVTSIDASTGEESLPVQSNTLTTSNDTLRGNTISWSAAANSALYTIYLYQNGVAGLIGTTPNTTFNDMNFAPTLNTTPPQARNPFSGAGNFPGTSMYFQQRHVRGGTTNNPDTIYTSQVGNFYNMSISVPSTDSDAITATLTSREVNAIRHFVPVKQDLLCFTVGNEWRITSNGQAFTAANIDILPQSSWGCNYLEPILLGLTVMFVRENGLTVRSARYTYVQDAYTGEDITLLSGHLFTPQTQILAWAQGLTPDPLVICALGGGGIACLTYQEEQQISAWTRWDTQNGAFESVDIVNPNAGTGVDDVPYFEVLRTIQGVAVRTIERLASSRFTAIEDCFYVDGGLTFDEPTAITNVLTSNPVTIIAPGHQFTNTSLVRIDDINWAGTLDDTGNPIFPAQLNGANYSITVIDGNTFTLNGIDGTAFSPYANNGNARPCVNAVSGLNHLEGQLVAALCDGNAYLNLGPVFQGGISLPGFFARVHAGLQIIADVGTIDLEPPQGSLLGKVKRVPSVTLRVQNTRGILVGETTADLLAPKDRQYEDFDSPTTLYTGDLIISTGNDWNRDGRMFIRQMYPLPMEILAIAPNMEAED